MKRKVEQKTLILNMNGTLSNIGDPGKGTITTDGDGRPEEPGGYSEKPAKPKPQETQILNEQPVDTLAHSMINPSTRPSPSLRGVCEHLRIPVLFQHYWCRSTSRTFKYSIGAKFMHALMIISVSMKLRLATGTGTSGQCATPRRRTIIDKAVAGCRHRDIGSARHAMANAGEKDMH